MGETPKRTSIVSLPPCRMSVFCKWPACLSSAHCMNTLVSMLFCIIYYHPRTEIIVLFALECANTETRLVCSSFTLFFFLALFCARGAYRPVLQNLQVQRPSNPYFTAYYLHLTGVCVRVTFQEFPVSVSLHRNKRCVRHLISLLRVPSKFGALLDG